MPFDKRLEYRNAPGTFVYDEASKMLYLNGSVQFAGTLYLDHIKDSPDISGDDASSWSFPGQPSASRCNHSKARELR